MLTFVARWRAACLAASIATLVTLLPASAQSPAPANMAVEHYTAMAANVKPGAGDPVKIDLFRLSTDAERDEAIAAFAKGPNPLFDTLAERPPLGYIWTGDSTGSSIRYARRVALPGGGDRLILATTSYMTSDGRVWVATVQKNATIYPFVVTELRLDKTGGTGKMSLAANVVVDGENKTLALDNYATAPVILQGVKKLTAQP